mgnify:CR=1 FL=1
MLDHARGQDHAEAGFGGLFGGTWFPGQLKLPGAGTFRGLTEMILAKRESSPGHNPVNEHNAE